MKITIDLDQHEHRVYMTREDWHKDKHSQHWRETQWKSGTYRTTARNEPHKFPCIGPFMGTIYISNSHNKENIAWL